MAVPDTTTFTLQDVVTEVATTTDDLVDCFADAISGKFDATYSGDKDRLLNFRNYGAIASFASSIEGRGACELALDQTYYHSGSGALPVAGDIVYSDAGTTTLASGTRRRDATTTYFISPFSGAPGEVNAVETCP
jgi:hypothetical protein